jgi:ketosteroid isomerase-like protein
MAVVTGEQRNALVTPIPGVGPLRPTMSTQIVVRHNGRWRFAGTQNTPVIQPGDPAPVPSPVEDMSKLTQSPLSAEQKVVASLDERRAEAIANQDFDTLLKMMSPDYMHVYGGGTTSDRDDYIKQLKFVPRSYTRGPLQVRMYGDSAIVSGWLINTARFPNKPVVTYQVWCTQVAHRVNGQWQLVSQHMTPKLDMPKG